MLSNRIREPAFLLKAGAVLLVAAALGLGLHAVIRAQALREAERQATILKRVAGEASLLSMARARASSGDTSRLARSLRRALAGEEVEAVEVLDAGSRVAFSTRRQAAAAYPESERLAQALQGRSAAGTSGEHDVVEVYVPLRGRTGSPAGALRMDLASGPFEAGVRTDTARFLLGLLTALGLLGAILVKTISGASSRLKDQAVQNEQLALRDTLTELPNRALFNRLLEQALAECPHDAMVAVLLMDLDRFKEINDTLGHFNGDLVLQRVGERLRTVLREGDTVARLGGDEFAMLLPQAMGRDSVQGAARRVHKALEEPFTAGGLTLKVEASIGIALYPESGAKAGALLRAADVAMYAAKKAHTGHEVYSPDQQQYSPARLGLVAQLNRAMDAGELELHYQPKARFSTGAVEGVEALVRWQHPQRGLLRPDEFIPVTEHTSMIKPVTIHLLEMALDQVREWEAQGHDLTVAVNLSTQILLDLGLPGEIERMLSRAGAPASKLELEITESAIVYDPRRAQVVLEGLHEMGLRIAIDDFGTGYSSLVSLKHLPVSTIKIDKSFVMGMERDHSDAAIVRSTAQLGQNLGLEVVAEGVETPSAWKRLAELGCDFAQGFYLSRALPNERFLLWLGAYREMCEMGMTEVPGHVEVPPAAGRQPVPAPAPPQRPAWST